MDPHSSDEPQVSIIIPVRNRSDLLLRCLKSLAEQDATPHSFEILVCNDGSEEDLAAVTRRFHPGPPTVRLLSQSPKGPAAARNLGLRATEAPTIIFLDSDVVADKEFVRHLTAALMKHPEWMGAEALLMPEGSEGPLWDAPACLQGGRFHTAAMAYRRCALAAAGGLDECFRLPACEDVELAARVLARGPVGFVPIAKVRHPRRRVSLASRWRARRHWRYVTILAKRYGFLAFPGQSAGSYPRIRVALAALLTLPLGKGLESLKHLRSRSGQGMQAVIHALFDILCGLCALPEILLGPIPERRDYLQEWDCPPPGAPPPASRLEYPEQTA